MMKWNKTRKKNQKVKDQSSAKFYKEQKKHKDPRFLHILAYTQDDDAVGGSGEMWEGKIRILRKQITDVQQQIQNLSGQVDIGQKDFNNEFAEIREQISEIKNEQKRATNEVKHDVMLRINEVNQEVKQKINEVNEGVITSMEKILKRLPKGKNDSDNEQVQADTSMSRIITQNSDDEEVLNP